METITKTMEMVIFDGVNTTSKKCLYINRDNKAVTKSKVLYNVCDLIPQVEAKNVYLEVCKSDLCSWVDFKMYIDYGFICSYSQTFRDDLEVSKLVEALNKWNSTGVLTYDYMKGLILGNAISGQFVNIQEIELFKLAGEDEETVNILVNARQQYINNRDKKEQQERQNREKQQQEKLKERQEEYKNAIAKAEKLILEKQTLFNDTIKVYTDYYTYEEKTIVLELFKKYNINVPLKTQGWINKALGKVEYTDKQWTYSYYTSSRNSTVFIGYLLELIDSIYNAYNLIDTDIKNTMQENKQKEDKLNTIPTIKWIDTQFRDQVDFNIFKRSGEVIEMSMQELEKVARIAYKALRCKDIDNQVNNYITIHEICGDNERSCYSFSSGNSEINVYPRLVKGTMKYLFTKSTNKNYHSFIEGVA